MTVCEWVDGAAHSCMGWCVLQGEVYMMLSDG